VQLFKIFVSKRSVAVLNMIPFPDHDPTGFCISELDPDWTGFWKYLYRIGYGYPNCIDHCSRMLNQSFFGYKPDWIKYFRRSTRLGWDRITQRKYLTGSGFQKSPICSTLVRSGYRSVSGPSYLKSYSSVTCNARVTHDECIVECTRFGINVLNPKPNP